MACMGLQAQMPPQPLQPFLLRVSHIPDKIIHNYLIEEPVGGGAGRLERKYRKSVDYYDSNLLEDIKAILANDPKVQEFYDKHPKDYINAVKVLSIEEIEDGDGKR